MYASLLIQFNIPKSFFGDLEPLSLPENKAFSSCKMPKAEQERNGEERDILGDKIICGARKSLVGSAQVKKMFLIKSFQGRGHDYGLDNLMFF
jgi:hypothetical protein